MMSDFAIRFAVHLIALWNLSCLLYYPMHRDRDSASGFFMLGMVIFLTTYWLKGVPLSMGFAFGLFAIFSILRYRTETMTMTQMTYLFIGIAMAMLNSAAPLAWPYLLAMNAAILLLLVSSQSKWFLPKEHCQTVIYDRIELISPDKHEALIGDLAIRMGLPISRVEIESTNFLNDTAILHVYYSQKR